jgi:EAL domain-containing protein (putative c-di-GMP-specific phosphodiesterase class I)
MEKECIHCGIPFRLYEKGSLFIEGANEAHDGTFNRVEGWLQAEYESVEELESLLDKAGKKFHKERNAGISNSAVKPQSISTLGSLIARVSERETVELINHGELVSYLQPIVSLQNRNEIYGYESLLRTEGPKQISPGVLFGTAHETGLLSLLDKRAREAAIKAKKEKIPNGIKSFINFLPSTIYNPAYCLQHTFDLVNKYQIDPKDLVFEVVESEKIEDIQHLKKVLYTYKKQGMKVALDDVGTGFSTLDVLEMLNPDYVKIDRKYISYCDQQASNQEFLSRVMELAKKLKITVLAEGIERVEELEYCTKAGVDLAQGYYLGKPSLNAQTSYPDIKLA